MGHLRPCGGLLVHALELLADDLEFPKIRRIGRIPLPAAVLAGTGLAAAVLIEAAQAGRHGQRLGHGHLAVRREQPALAVDEAQLIEGHSVFIVPRAGVQIGKLSGIGAGGGKWFRDVYRCGPLPRQAGRQQRCCQKKR